MVSLGILKQGLRIAPPEGCRTFVFLEAPVNIYSIIAPVTGYMFGKGVYFADVRLCISNH